MSETLSVIVPAFNEEEVLPEFHRRLSAVLDDLPFDSEIIYVDDGSGDQTAEALHRLAAADSRVGVIELSRNFGKEIAVSAGLDAVCADAAVIIDADLQDPPEVIKEMVEVWKQGFDVVYGKRTERRGESYAKRATAALFYRFIQKLSRVKIPEDAGDFRLLSRRAIASLRKLREQHRFMKGLFAWIGYPQAAVPYCRDPRFRGSSKWSYWRLWNFALEGFTSFTTLPLRLASYLGLGIAAFGFVYAAVIIFRTLVYGETVRGYPSLMVVILCLGGVQLVSLGVIGEYLGRMFDEAKGRPLYFVKAVHTSDLQRKAGQQAASGKCVGTQSATQRIGPEVKPT